jgi:hypothetical protein
MHDIDDTLNYYFPQPETLTAAQLMAVEGTMWSALLYSSLFLPETEVVNDVVFLKSWQYESEAAFVDYRKRLLRELESLNKQDRKRQLSDFNWVELHLAIHNEYHNMYSSDQFLDSCYVLLAQKVALSWDAVLHRRYPSRSFVVSVISEEESGGSLGIMFEET